MTNNDAVVVNTRVPTTPLPPNTERQEIRTARLLLRPFRQDDLQALRVLRTQPEAMTGTTLGRPDRNSEETQKFLDNFLPPSDVESFLFGAFLASTGELIGEGGIHTLESSMCGWPELGYKFKKEYWGQGFATEFLRGVLEPWWSLPRCNVETKVHPLTAEETGISTVEEKVYANTEIDNIGSQNVLRKLGFVRFLEWTEPDTQEHRLGEPLTLVGFMLSQKGDI